MPKISNLFFQGLAAVLPITISIMALYWLANRMETGLGTLFQRVLPKAYYLPGMGMAAGIVLIFIAGILMELWIVRRLFTLGERILNSIPLLKTIYGGVQDLLSFFSSDEKEESTRKVVMAEVAPGIEVLGLVTREDLDGLPKGVVVEGEQRVAVYLPMSYQIGGYTLFLPPEKIRPVEMTVEEAMRFAVTAGMSTEKKK
ncbi:MAG: DUF502 domain-containing protein [Planctomycetota bacterium]|jgi:uncharacterized membrane protein